MPSEDEHKPNPVIGVKDFASALGYHPQTVRDLAAAGQIPDAFRVGKHGHWRFPHSSIDAFKIKNSPHRTQTSSSGDAADGDPSGPVPQDGDKPAGMPAGSFETNRAG